MLEQTQARQLLENSDSNEDPARAPTKGLRKAKSTDISQENPELRWDAGRGASRGCRARPCLWVWWRQRGIWIVSNGVGVQSRLVGSGAGVSAQEPAKLHYLWALFHSVSWEPTQIVRPVRVTDYPQTGGRGAEPVAPTLPSSLCGRGSSCRWRGGKEDFVAICMRHICFFPFSDTSAI